MKKVALLFMLLASILISIAWTSLAVPAPELQTIKICKQAKFAGSTAFPFQWSNATGPMAGFTLKAGECVTKTVDTKNGPTVFQENLPSGWGVANISCDNVSSVRITGNGDNPAFQPGDNAVSIESRDAASVTCTFTNGATKATVSTGANTIPLTGRDNCCDFTMDLSTGQKSGSIDSLWTLSPNSAYITTTLVGAWMDLLPAKWIQPTNMSTPDGGIAAGTYKYITTFEVTECQTGQVKLSGSYAADDTAQAFLDDQPIAGSSCGGGNCFKTPKAPIPLNVASIPPGLHTLRIDVVNGKSYSGLIVKAQLEQVCPPREVVPGKVIKQRP